MKRMLRNLISNAFYRFNVLRGVTHKGVRILCYHRVNEISGDYLTVPYQNFEMQMHHLAKARYRTVGLENILKGEMTGREIVVTFDDGYLDNYEYAFSVMRKYGFVGTIFCVLDHIGKADYLGLDHICEMAQSGFSFGCHTKTHPHLPEIGIDQKGIEIVQAKKALEDLTGLPIQYFCYPYGEFDPESVSVVKEAGFFGVCTNIPGANRAIDAFRLERTKISPEDSIDDFRKKLAGGFDFMHRALHAVRGRS